MLVHGAMDRGAGMAHLARALRDVPTLRYDRRGYGRARRLGTGDLVCHVDDLVSIVGSRPVVLFGHSFGGLVVLSAAGTGRLDVRGLATWEVPTPWIHGWGVWRPDAMSPDKPITDRGDIAEGFMRATVGQARWEALPERTRRDRRDEGPALIADMDPVLAAGVPFDPRRITVRCVFGAGDVSSAPYVAGAQWLARRVPVSEVRVLPGATHGAPTSRAGDIAALIRAAAVGTSTPGHAANRAGGDDAVTD